MTLSKISMILLLSAFLVYCLSFLLFVLSITGKKWRKRNPEDHVRKWSRVSLWVTWVGYACHLGFFFTRWVVAGHIPTSNMFEFMTFLAMMIVTAFLILYAIYKTVVLGAFAIPVSILILAYAMAFPNEVQPLIPSLKSIWLSIHVTMASAGDAFFAIGFAAGLMHLIRTVDFSKSSASSKREVRWLELVMYIIVVLIGFIISTFYFSATHYQASFKHEIVINKELKQVETKYSMPPLIQPHKAETVQMQAFLGMEKPLLEAPGWMNGEKAARKLNTIVWSILAGSVLYGLLRLFIRKPISEKISPLLKGMDPENLDEISYRSIAIGYPIFTLGGLIFAMIWANQAWGRFWGWDPKEVWALITWLFYAAYLHLRLSRSWQGKKSSWLAVVGFIIVMFTLVGVNLIIAGLHSYAGV